MKNKKKYIFLLILVLGIGFALVSSNLSILGHAGIKGGNFQVEFDKDNLRVDSHSVELSDVVVDETSITFTSERLTPGDNITFTIPVVNKGTVDAMIDSFTLTGLDELSDYVTYTVKYGDGRELAKGQLLEKESYDYLTLKVEYNDNMMLEDAVEVEYSFDITYVIADSNATVVEHANFTNDSWEEIANNVRNGYSAYYEVGDEKTVTVTGYGDHPVRVANNSYPDVCRTDGFSQSACGFVVEFADIIESRKLNDSESSLNGWPKSTIRNYLNTDFIDKISGFSEYIIDTYTVSGHGNNDGPSKISTDKLFLLSPGEIWANGSSNLISGDSSIERTRQLDIYYIKGVKSDVYGGCIKKYNGSNTSYWLRSAHSSYSANYFNVYTDGNHSFYLANSPLGVSPAFRIG